MPKYFSYISLKTIYMQIIFHHAGISRKLVGREQQGECLRIREARHTEYWVRKTT